MLELWNLLLYHPLINSLIAIYKLTHDLGWSIVILTAGLRTLMTPIILPGLKISQKIAALAPQIAKLKEKYAGDKQGLMTAQAELYKQHGASPAAGCLPQIIQLLVLIALFNAFNSVLKANGADVVSRLNPLLYSFNQLPDDFSLSTRFLYLDLAKPDIIRLPNLPLPLPGLFLLLAALTQWASSKMMSPEVTAEKKVASATPSESDDSMVLAQQQMLVMMPLMIIIFGFQFPSGLVLYQLALSVVSMIQQFHATGLGGLRPYLTRLKMIKS